MAPAVFFRIENKQGKGWTAAADFYNLDTHSIPTFYQDAGFNGVGLEGRYFAYNPESFDHWVSESDRRVLQRQGFYLTEYYCSPGTFHIGHEQVVFDKAAARTIKRRALQPRSTRRA